MGVEGAGTQQLQRLLRLVSWIELLFGSAGESLMSLVKLAGGSWT